MAWTADARTLPADELDALTQAVARLGTQAAVARALGVSSATVSQALTATTSATWTRWPSASVARS